MSENPVVISEDNLVELMAMAGTPLTSAQRVAGTLQALVVIAAAASVVPVGAYAWTRCQDWLDERRLRRNRTGRNLTSVG